MEKLAAECTKPSDASDIGSKEDAVAEVQRLRQLFKDITTLQNLSVHRKLTKIQQKSYRRGSTEMCSHLRRQKLW